jgi:hypothetical protein
MVGEGYIYGIFLQGDLRYELEVKEKVEHIWRELEERR